MDLQNDNFSLRFEEDETFPNWVRVGPKRYFLPKCYRELAPQYYNFQIRPDDIFLIGFPRSGTTLSQETIWLLNNNLDYEAAKTNVSDRFPLLDVEVFMNTLDPKPNVTETEREAIKILTCPIKRLSTTKSQRFIKSHLPLSLLPPKLLDTVKVVYIARDPRDAAVSLYHLFKLRVTKDANFKVFWDKFRNGNVLHSPYFEHLKEFWAQRHQPNMLFCTYEELTQDTMSTLRRMADFFGQQYSEQQLTTLCDHLRFDRFRDNPAVNRETTYKALGVVDDGEQAFIRKGKIGGWQEYFDEDMREEAKHWMTKNMEGIDLPFKP